MGKCLSLGAVLTPLIREDKQAALIIRHVYPWWHKAAGDVYFTVFNRVSPTFLYLRDGFWINSGLPDDVYAMVILDEKIYPIDRMNQIITRKANIGSYQSLSRYSNLFIYFGNANGTLLQRVHGNSCVYILGGSGDC